MSKIILPAMISLILFMPVSRLFGDIIITNDDMILNGKILKDAKPVYIDFANYHGTFNIDYKQIKKIIRTESYEADVKIIEEMGQPVNKEEIKINYEAGLEKLEEHKIETEKGKEKIRSSDYVIFFSAFYNLNFGRIGSILPNSMDFSAACDIPLVQFRIIKMLHLAGIRGGIAYFHSKNGEKGITGFRVSTGPLWQLPVSFGKVHFNYCISPSFGIGRYSVSGLAKKAAGVKWNTGVTTGPFFKISSIIICPQLKFDYIYDGSNPLYGIGFGLGAGFCF
jgi:hypothetical protein